MWSKMNTKDKFNLHITGIEKNNEKEDLKSSQSKK